MKNGGSFHCYVNVHQRVLWMVEKFSPGFQPAWIGGLSDFAATHRMITLRIEVLDDSY